MTAAGPEEGAGEPAGVDALYDLPTEDFTAARNALVRQLKAAKEKDAAAAVQQLRKPSITAWAVNQLARRHPEELERVLIAGEELRRAHGRALAGDASGLREATKKEQDAVGAAARVAVGLLEEAGGSGAGNIDRISETLRTAATNEEAGVAVGRGRLEADLQSIGFGLSDTSALAPAPPRKLALVPEPEAGEVAEEVAARAATAAAEAEAARAEAAGVVARARKVAERTRTKADEAEGRAARLEREAAQATRLAAEAQKRADQAREAAVEADRTSTDAEAALAAAEERLLGLR